MASLPTGLVRTNFQGLLVPDPRINETLSSTYSGYSEQGPIVGVAEDQGSSSMVLETSGTQSSGDELRVRANRAGFPGADSRAGGFVYKDSTNTDYRGWDTPNAITGWEWIDFVSDSNTTSRHQQPHIIRLASGDALMVHRVSGTSYTASSTTYAPRIVRFSGSAGTWTGVVTLSPKSPTNANLYPCLLQLPSGRIQLYFWVVDTDAKEAQVEMWFSDDDGATWAVGNRYCLADSLQTDGFTVQHGVDTDAYNVRRIRAAYNSGQVCLVTAVVDPVPVAPYGNLLIQWASDDLGVRFSQVYFFGLTTATVTCSANPANGDTLTIAGVVLTCTTGTAGVDQWKSDASASTNATRIAAAITSGSNSFHGFCTAVAGGTGGDVVTITITSAKPGLTLSSTGTKLACISEENGAAPEVLPASNGGFCIAYTSYNMAAADQIPLTKTISNAYEPMGDVSLLTMSDFAYPVSSSDLAVWPGEDGAWYATTYSTGDNNNQLVLRSVDEAQNWVRMDSGSAGDGAVEGLWHGGDSTVYLTDFTGCEVRGRSVLVSRSVANTENHNLYSLMALYLGGHSTVTMPSHSLFSTDVSQLAWSNTWIALEEPDNFSGVWAKSSAGSPTHDIESAGLKLVAPTGSDSISYKHNIDTTITQEVICYAVVQVDSGSGKTMLRLDLADGSHEYRALVSVGTGGFTAGDYYGSPDSDAPSLSTTSGIEFLVAIRAGKMFLWYRASSSGLEREWTTWSSNNGCTLTDNGAGSATGFVSFGFFGSNAATAHWRTVNTVTLPAGIVGLSNGQTNPDDLFSRFFSRTGGQLPSGARIAAVDGPCVEGDSWNVDARAQYPVTNLCPAVSPSPRQQWRSLDTSQQVLAWDLSTGEDSDLGSTSIAIALLNTNIASATLAGIDGTGAHNIATITNGYSNLKYLRHGSSIVVDTGSTTAIGSKWIAYGELVGGYVHIDDGSGGHNHYVAITSNTEGRWYADGGRHPVITIDPATEHLDTFPTSGNLRVVFPNVVQVLHGVGAYRALRLTIPTATTPTDDFRIGNVVLGPVAVFGHEYGWGRALETTPNTELVTRRGGTRYSRNLGPSRRKVEYGWPDGVDTSDVFRTPSSSSTPPAVQLYTGTSGQNYVAAPADTPLLVEGLLDYLDGPDKPVVYLPALTQSASSTVQTFFHREDLMYGRVVSTGRREVIQGTESASEVVRISTFTLEEEK